jgi:hypothetical protein
MRFEVRNHAVRQGEQLVEVFGDDGRLLAVIYPHAQGLHVTSKYMTGFAQTHGILPIPGVLVILETG